MISALIEEWLTKLGISPDILTHYDEPHRFYHNRDHIEDLVGRAVQRGILDDELLLAIVFHDIVYNPKESNNEELSAKLYKETHADYIEDVYQAILDTKTHEPTNKISNILCKLDLHVLYGDFKTFVEFEHKIFKEYQWVDYKTYQEKRVEILTQLKAKPEFIDYVRNRKLNTN